MTPYLAKCRGFGVAVKQKGVVTRGMEGGAVDERRME